MVSSIAINCFSIKDKKKIKLNFGYLKKSFHRTHCNNSEILKILKSAFIFLISLFLFYYKSLSFIFYLFIYLFWGGEGSVSLVSEWADWLDPHLTKNTLSFSSKTCLDWPKWHDSWRYMAMVRDEWTCYILWLDTWKTRQCNEHWRLRAL
jgi:hypothetical protein